MTDTYTNLIDDISDIFKCQKMDLVLLCDAINRYTSNNNFNNISYLMGTLTTTPDIFNVLVSQNWVKNNDKEFLDGMIFKVDTEDKFKLTCLVITKFFDMKVISNYENLLDELTKYIYQMENKDLVDDCLRKVFEFLINNNYYFNTQFMCGMSIKYRLKSCINLFTDRFCYGKYDIY
jgi:hypothetical protein